MTIDGSSQTVAVGGREWFVVVSGSKTPRRLIVNGITVANNFTSLSTSAGRTLWASNPASGTPPSGTAFNGIPSANVQYGMNANFSDDSYWEDEVSHFGRLTPAVTTPASRSQKVLTKGGVQDWLNVGFHGPAIDTTKSMKLMAEELDPGTKADKSLSLAASGSNFTVPTPFPGISRITFNADSTETELLNRYSVTVPHRQGVVGNPSDLFGSGCQKLPPDLL